MKSAFKNNLLALAFNALVGILIASICGFNPILGALGLNIIMLGFAFFKTFYTGRPLMRAGLLYAGLFKEIWIGKLMENFYPDDSFLVKSVDLTAFVENNTINLADAGVDPVVLVNNTTYPIPMSERTDNPIAIPLDYFDTENTVVRNATAIQLAYNKLESVIRQHRLALRKTNVKKAAHAYGPQSNTAWTPVLSIGASNIIDVFIDAEAAFDEFDVPQEDRIVLLCPTHKAALKKADKVLFKEVFGQNGSKVLYSFQVYSTSVTPTYNGGVKNAFGAAPAAGDVPSSLFYSAQEVMRADGEYDMFSRLKDPEARGDIIGFSKRFVALPIRNKAIGAIIG